MKLTYGSVDKRERLLLLGALLCGILNHVLFYNKAWGMSYPLFMLVFYAYFYWAVKERSELRFDASLLMLLPILLLSLTYMVFTNRLFLILNALAVPVLIVIQTTFSVHRPKIRWYDGSMAIAVLEQLLVHTLHYIPLPVKRLAQALSGKINASRSRHMWRILAGVAISAPILLLVGSLLASADTMFDRTIAMLPEVFGKLELFPFLWRAAWIGAVSLGIFAYVYGLLHPKEKSRYPEEADEAGIPFSRGFRKGGVGEWNEAGIPDKTTGLRETKPFRLEATMTSTVLVMLNAVYVLFAVLQFSYFFAGGSASLPDGITYAEYAHRGFAELVIVTLINLTLVMGTLHGTDRSIRSMDRLLRVLLAMLIGCTGVMLCSAYFRLAMYEEAYGYTVTRVLVHAFMIFLAVLFLLALVKVARDRFGLLKPYLIAAIAAYVLLNYAQIDGIIASGNIQRYEATGQIDAGYLESLSMEAVPYLLELKRSHPGTPGIDEALERFKARLPQPGNSVFSFNISEWRAAKALQNKPLQPSD